LKSILLLVSCLIIASSAFARHGKGGSITYEYAGDGSAAGTSKYRITVKHYIDCAGTQFIEPTSFVGIFNATSFTLVSTLSIAESNRITIQKTNFDPCINQPPTVCYVVVTYIRETELPDNIAGYVLAEQECCRIGGIINIQNSSTYGITNINIIPGVINGVVYRTNNSPVFAQKDTVVICHNSYFSLDFSATDKDGDKLIYDFTPGKTGGSAQIRQPNPPTSPPYSDLLYQSGFSAAQPLGTRVTIDKNTGNISGIAPPTLGSYIVSVNVSEYRNGILIGLSKKEVQVTVADCSLSAALLKPVYNKCDDSTFRFQNLSFSTNVSAYHWDFGVLNKTTDTSTAPTPSYTYSDTGTYTIKLSVTSVAGCEDSTKASVLVYPGFESHFKLTGSCYQSPFLFNDSSYAKYGTVNSWLWDFGDSYAASNSSSLSNPSHLYGTTGSYTVSLIAGSTKGCVDTTSAIALVSDKPFLSLPFKDTLICSIDTLALHAVGNGIFSWAPAGSIANSNTASPFVYPKTFTKYIVTLDEKGCIAKDTVTVNVLDSITVSLPADATICKGDSLQLSGVSEGLQYRWSPGAGLSNSIIKNPKAAPQTDTKYQVVANVGKCQATASINVKVVPYPQVVVSNDTTICYGTIARLNASIKGSSFNWSPAAGLQNINTLSPVAHPLQATSYVLTVFDTIGCPKPSKDTVRVSVLPRINAFAGNDTLVVAGQPLQLHATGGTAYLWSPGTFLNNLFIADPLSSPNASIDSITYTVRVSNEACFSNDSVKVKIFKTPADIFVPSAFTPNGDGNNDLLKPIPVGIKYLETFKVYNRWGQLVYSTNQAGKGWDGRINGIPQQSGAFVYVAIGTSYLNKKIMRKGTALLVR
jgi:gliding motility-associated-like protein